MISIRIVFYLFIFLFFSNSLYAESMHFDCKCNYEYQSFGERLENDRIKEKNYCADVHLEIKPDTKQMRVVEDTEYGFHQETMPTVTLDATDMSFRLKYEDDDSRRILRFDRYTGTLTEWSRSINTHDDTRDYRRRVFRCEKVDKKY